MYGLPSVCVVPVIPVCIYMLFPDVLFVFCMSEEVISSFKSLRARSLVFGLPMLFLCVTLHTM